MTQETDTSATIATPETIRIICDRHAKRAFLPDRPIPNEIIRTVLDAAKNAPSTQNTQPWGVTVIKGRALHKLREHLLDKYDRGEMDTPGYENRPSNPTIPEFDESVAEYGKALFGHKNLDRFDTEARRAHDRENYTFFNAPLHLLVHAPKRAVEGTFLDMGFFLQNVMIGFLAYGIDTCPQYSITRYSETLHQFDPLGEGSAPSNPSPLLPRDRVLVCGLSVGYADKDAKINSFVPRRQPMSTWVRWATDEEIEEEKERR